MKRKNYLLRVIFILATIQGVGHLMMPIHSFAQTTFLGDNNKVTADGEITLLTQAGNTAYFATSRYLNGSQYATVDLWLTDGTEAGTKEVCPNFMDSIRSTDYTFSINGLIAYQGELYFFIQNHGLCKTDGTEAGTMLVKSTSSYDGSGGAFYPDLDVDFTIVNNILFFRADQAPYGMELWKTDGTGAGTQMVKDIHLEFVLSSGSNPDHLTPLGSNLIFSAIDVEHGREIWISDGTEAGTQMLKDISPGLYGSVFDEDQMDDIYVFNGEAYFLVEISSSNLGGGINSAHYLYKTDGTTAGTVEVFEFSGYPSGELLDGKFIEYNNELYFVFENKTYKTDGTTAGTTEVWTYRAEDFAVYDSKLFMFVKEWASPNGSIVYKDGGLYYTTGTSVNQLATTDIIKPNPFIGILNSKLLYHNGELYNYDNSGENMVKDIWLGDSEGVVARTWVQYLNDYSDGPGQFVNMGSYVLFYGNDATGGNLWKSDGTAGGTEIVKRLHNEGAGNVFEYPPYAAAIGTDIIFPAENQTGEVWKTDGTLASTQKIANTEQVYQSRIGSKLLSNGTNVFMTTGEKVYVTDGTAGGTIGLTATDGVTPGLDEDFGVIHPVNGKLIFNGPIDANGQSRLYVSDGSNAGTSELKQLYGNGSLGSKYKPNTFAASSNHVYFMASSSSGASQETVYKTDGTNATTEWVLAGFTLPKLLGNSGDTLYLTQADNGGLYKLEPGSTTATLLKADIKIVKFIMGDTHGLFIVNNPSSDRGIWMTDGTAAGTVKIQSTFNSNTSDYLIENDSSLYYTEGNRLYEVEKQSASRTLVLDNVTQFLEFNNKIAIINQYSNIFLWDYNVEDLIGIYSSDTLSNFHSAYAQGNKLFFRASGQTIGDELFCYELPPDPTIQVMRQSFNYSNNNSVWIGTYVNNDTIDGFGYVAEAWVDDTVEMGEDNENVSDVYFAIANSGPSTLTISQTELTGDFADRFQLTGMPTQIAPYSIERFKASFTGDSIHGDIFAMLKIYSNDPLDPVFNLRLKGESLSNPLLITNDSLGEIAFLTEHKLALTDVGQTSYDDLYAINYGYGNVGIIDSVVVSGVHASDFVVTPNKTGVKAYKHKLIDPADQQDSLLNNDNFHAKLTIAYTPSDNGDRFATLKIYSSTSVLYPVQTIELSGYAGCMANDIITPEETQVLCIGSDDSITFTYPHVDNADYCWGYLGDWTSVGSPDFMVLSGSSTLDYKLHFDTANVPIAMISDNNKISVVRFNGSEWGYLGDQYIATSAYEPSLAIDNDNNIYLSYRKYISGNHIYTVLKYDGMSWNQLGADNAGGELATIGADLYAVNSRLNQFSRATVVKWTGSTWDTIGAPGFTAASALNIQLEANNGTLYVAFQDGAHVNSGLSVMKFDGSSWVYVGNKGISQGEVADFQLDFDNTGKMYVRYQAHALDYSFKINEVKVFENGTWNSLDFDTYRRPLDEQLTASMDLWDNVPYVAYNESNPNSQTVQIVKHPGAAWQGYLSDTPMDDVASLAQETMFRFDNNGIPYFIYSGRTQGDYSYYLNVIAHDPNAECLSTTTEFTTGTPGRYKVKITDTLNVCSYYSLNTVTVIEEECFPEIDVTGNGNTIYNNSSSVSLDNNTIMGVTVPGDSIDRRFIIHNLGTADLILSDSVRVQDYEAIRFKIAQQPQFSIPAGDTSSFVVRFLPSDYGTIQTNVYIQNNDESESTFKFRVKGDANGITVIKTDSLIYDQNTNSKLNSEDTLQYTIVVANDANAPVINSISLYDEIPSLAFLQVGTVTSQIGAIGAGNNPGETAYLQVVYSALNPAAVDTVTFKVVLAETVPSDATVLSNQAYMFGGSALGIIYSDDPDYPGNSDPTITPYEPQCTNPTDGGTIGIAQTICSGATPLTINNITLPSGQVGTLEYKWQSSTTSATADFSDIAASNSESHAPGALITTTWYKRLAIVDCSTDWTGAVESNVIAITVPTIAPPVLTIQSNTTTTATTSTANGTITQACVNATNRGAIWWVYTDTDKEIGGTDVTNVDESGDFGETTFTAALTGLSANTRYNVRAHATNPDGTGYSPRTDFRTLANVPATPTVDGATATSLDVIVNVNSNPASTEFVIAETSTGKFVQANGSLNTTPVWQTAAAWGSITVNSLTTGTTYSFKVKARNGDNIETDFSSDAQGVPVAVPAVSTQAVATIATTTATGNGTITNTNGDNASNRGAIWYPYTDTDKAIGDADVTNVDENGDFGTGVFTALFTALDVNTQYNTRAHATNQYGTGYGERESFWTLANVPAAPTVDGATATTLDVTIQSNGNPTGTRFCIMETSTSKFVQNDGTLGAFPFSQTGTQWGTIAVNGLTTGLTYTFKVQAYNGADVATVFGDGTEGTPVAAPTVTTQATSDIAATTATGNGTITTTNGDNATNRGLIWYPFTNTDKAIGEAEVTNVAEDGDFTAEAFTADFTGLDVNTHYNVRAHATNPQGTGYGDRVDFWTLANVPDAPTVDGATASSLDVTVSVNGNPAGTEYCINQSGTAMFVQTDGSLNTTEVWQTATAWGTVTINNLNTSETYTFRVKARNGELIETAYSEEASGTTCTNPTDGGIIAADQLICEGSIPNPLTSTSGATGHGGTLEYKWQQSTSSSTTGFSDIENSNSASYAPGNLYATTWFKRLARVDCMDDWTGAVESNVVEIAVYDAFDPGEIQTDGETICYDGDPMEIGSSADAGGGDGLITYSWEFSADDFTTPGSEIVDATSPNYDPPAGLTVTTSYRRYAKDESCNTSFVASAGTWKVTVQEKPEADAGDDATVVEGETHTLASGDAEHFTTVNWSSDGDGNFNDAGVLNPEYTPGSGDIAYGEVELCIESFPVSPCLLSDTDCMTLTILRYPEVEIASPADGEHNYDYPLTVAGTASDADGDLSKIMVRYNSGQWEDATGTGNWNTELHLLFGNFVLEAKAVDSEGLESEIKQVTFFNGVHQVPLYDGWSMVSSYLEPIDADLETIMQEPVADEEVMIMINESGNLYWPPENINLIGNWANAAAYLIKMLKENSVLIKGDLPENNEVSLHTGYNYLPVITNVETDIDDAFENPSTDIKVIYCHRTNQVYWPYGGIYTLNTLSPGEGYLALLNAPATVTFNDYDMNNSMSPDAKAAPADEDGHWQITRTGISHLIALNRGALDNLDGVSHIGAFTGDGRCAGQANITGTTGNVLLTVYGKDSYTSDDDGFQPDEYLSFRGYNPAEETETTLDAVFSPAFPQCNGMFADNGLSMINGFKSVATGLGENSLLVDIRVYPNPANDMLNINLTGPGDLSGLTATLIAADGRPVKTFELAGEKTTVNISNLLPGVYLLHIESGENIQIECIVVTP